MRRTLFAFLLATVLPLTAEACVDATWPREALLRLKADAFVPAEGVDRYATALKLIGCLASPDPVLRDGVAYEGLSTWLRQKAFDAEQMRELRTRLYERMDAPDKDEFAVPFVALVLSELARTDRIEAWMTDQERADMLAKATAYLRSVSDYRGFEADSGWRHGVAHGADWLMQLALNPKLDVDQLRQLTDAVASQVRAADGHAYVYGESARLARPVLFAARRDIRTDAEWTAWMDSLSAGMADPKLAYQDAAWLAARHNLAAFFSTIYFEADHGGLESLKPLQNAAAAALKAIP